MIDLIGDIHGHADKLELLLRKLGYAKKGDAYCHSGRKALFVGDYIDRGPQIPETLFIVRQMVESGHAIALMGNQEYNALCFQFESATGGHLRRHSIKNILQHTETLRQFHNRQREYDDYLEWFFTLPLFYEEPRFRAVHACWDEQQVALLRQKLVNGCLDTALLVESVKKNTSFNDAVEQTLKGRELQLPRGMSFRDKDGSVRQDIRIKWWENPASMTYRSLSVEAIENLPEEMVDTSLLSGPSHYSENDRMVFFGHYWLKGNPTVYRSNICCLDYSVAKGGHLVAYRLDDEQELKDSKFAYV